MDFYIFVILLGLLKELHDMLINQINHMYKYLLRKL